MTGPNDNPFSSVQERMENLCSLVKDRVSLLSLWMAAALIPVQLANGHVRVTRMLLFSSSIAWHGFSLGSPLENLSHPSLSWEEYYILNCTKRLPD